MTETETGWTKEFPTAAGDYWYRWQDQRALFSIVGGKVFVAGFAEAQHPPLNGAEWLRVSPSDAEELMELRRVVREFLTIDPAEHVERWCEIEASLERLIGVNANPSQAKKER